LANEVVGVHHPVHFSLVVDEYSESYKQEKFRAP